MKYYPVNLDIQNQKCLVVGGGSVGTRKVMTLLDCDARVTVVSPVVSTTLIELAENGTIGLILRPYQSADLIEMFLIISATNNEKLNCKISADARNMGKLCNMVDRPEAGNFILPSIIRRGDLLIAISTAGKSPAFAKKLRKDLEKQFGEEYADFLQLMGSIRKKLLSKKHAPEIHKHLFEQLISRDLIHMIRNHQKEKINSLLFEIFGEGYEYDLLIKYNT